MVPVFSPLVFSELYVHNFCSSCWPLMTLLRIHDSDIERSPEQQNQLLSAISQLESFETFQCDYWHICDDPDNALFFWGILPRFERLRFLDSGLAAVADVVLAVSCLISAQKPHLGSSCYPSILPRFVYCVGCFNRQSFMSLLQDFGFPFSFCYCYFLVT